MNATELIVELVLTGILALAALLLPILASMNFQPELTAETVALWIAAGFLIGVVVDRCADSILERWEGFVRCKYAYTEAVSTARAALVAGRSLEDAFPEGWMRVRMMSKGSEGVVKWLEQSRVRIRIARTVAVLVPAMTASVLAAMDICADCSGKVRPELCAAASGPWGRGVLVPMLHLLFLVICFACAEWCSKLRPPRTNQAPYCAPPVWVAVLSASSLWFSLQLALAIWVMPKQGSSTAILALGILLTVLATLTWWRLTHTFMAFNWTFCRSEHAGDLAEQIAPTASAE
jgi:hypothetical protein